jgi:hypothetical protein
MPANSAQFTVCEGGVDVTRFLILVSEAGWVAAGVPSMWGVVAAG